MDCSHPLHSSTCVMYDVCVWSFPQQPVNTHSLNLSYVLTLPYICYVLYFSVNIFPITFVDLPIFQPQYIDPPMCITPQINYCNYSIVYLFLFIFISLIDPIHKSVSSFLSHTNMNKMNSLHHVHLVTITPCILGPSPQLM